MLFDDLFAEYYTVPILLSPTFLFQKGICTYLPGRCVLEYMFHEFGKPETKGNVKLWTLKASRSR